MKRILNFLFLIFIFIFGYGLFLYLQPEIQVPKFLVQMSVKKKFPIEKNYVVGKIKLSNPKTSIIDDKLIIETNYSNEAVGDNIKGTMKFETSVKYDSIDSKLYLDDFKLIDVTKDGENIDLNKHPIIRTALNASFKKLEKDSILELKNFSFVEDIKIDKGKFIVYK